MSAFFILGVQRSGTTMLSVMLGKHRDILMEDKVKAFSLIGSYHNMIDLMPLNMGLDRAEFVEWIIQNDKAGRIDNLAKNNNIIVSTNYRKIIANSISNGLGENEKKIWGDKAPNLQHYIADLLLLIPDAKFIHIVRDGRATAASMSARTYRNIKLSAQMWVDGNTCGLVNQEVLGKDQYKIVKFEDIILSPENEMRDICNFLDLSYDPEIINLATKEKQGEKYVKNYLDQDKIMSWKQEISDKTLTAIEEIQGPTLQRFGYETATQRFKPLTLGKKLWLMQGDNWGNLFRAKKKGMKNREIITYNDSFNSRLKRFLMFYGNLFLSREITRTLYSKYFYKEKTKNSKVDNHE